MKTRIIHTKIWKDDFFSELTPTEKLLFIYFVTNERINIIHCYEITDREISFDTGIDRSAIGVFKQKTQAAGKFYFFKNHVYMCNAEKYETYTGEKNEAAKKKLIQEMNQEEKDWYTKIVDTPIDTPIYTPSIGTINHNTEIRSNNKGGVGGKETVTKKVISEIVEKYSVPELFVLSKFDDLCNWADEKPSNMRGRNWIATLKNWVKRDSLKIKQEEKKHGRRISIIPIR